MEQHPEITWLHPLLASRWSPVVFDEHYEVTDSAVELLLQAARWAPSAGNSQPWAFVLGRRGDPTHRRLTATLRGSSAGWAGTASLLLANLAHRYVEDTDWEYSEFAGYDLGQAVAQMTVQARALGMYARQFRAFDRDALAAEFAVPHHWQVMTMTAIGRMPARWPESGPVLDDVPLRHRRSLDELIWAEH